jgi:hypothetical protein
MMAVARREQEKAVPYILAVIVAGAASPWIDPITAEMRASLGRINAVHSGMTRKAVADAVDRFHRDIARIDSGLFVFMAVPHLMRLAPRDARTRALIHRAMAKGWIEEELCRAFLVQSGDGIAENVKALIKGLDARDVKKRKRAMVALGACSKAGAPALPRLREIIRKAKADPSDYRRAYTLADEVPEHVRAHWAASVIEAAIKDGKP